MQLVNTWNRLKVFVLCSLRASYFRSMSANHSEDIRYNEKGQVSSRISKQALSILEGLHSIVKEDPMGRNIDKLVVPHDFTKSALALSHSSSVAIVTGFPVHTGCDPPDETDGLPGVISLAAALQSLGKSVALIVDADAVNMNVKLIEKCAEASYLKEKMKVIPYVEAAEHRARLRDESGRPLYDVILATERAGRSRNGKYYGMKGRDVSALVCPVDDLFAVAQSSDDVMTIGIGDGGNELGMGKVLQEVRDNIPLGDQIACMVPADLLIAAGVSNWGCYGLALALFALSTCYVHEKSTSKDDCHDYMPTVERERGILQLVESFGIKDGVKPNQEMSVDGMYFDNEHTDVIQRMRELVGLN